MKKEYASMLDIQDVLLYLLRMKESGPLDRPPQPVPTPSYRRSRVSG